MEFGVNLYVFRVFVVKFSGTEGVNDRKAFRLFRVEDFGESIMVCRVPSDVSRF